MFYEEFVNNLFFTIVYFCLGEADGARRFRTEFLQEVPTPGTGPSFDTSVPNNITGLVGKTAYLNCRVKNLGNKTVCRILPPPIRL